MSANVADAKQIFLQAVENHEPERWPEFLQDACGANTGLRERVEALLTAYRQPNRILDTSSHRATLEPRSITEGPGTTIGPYKLLQQIGEGGMGVVFMAEQTEPLQRTVALKIIKPGMDTRQVIARFEAERQAVAMMDHPNIAKVLDAGTTDTGRPYFVMELVKGVPITKYCDEKHLPLRARLELFVQVCQAVQHAHQKGIIHRDIKPNNVLVAEYDNRAVPKVIDFGVAKATAQRLTEQTMFTEFGQVLGTMEYMSPEQSKFNQLDIDTRSDIYSLGVLLYELLAGSTPFEGERLHAAAFDEMLRIIREEEPPKPSTRLSSLTSRERLIDSLPLAGRDQTSTGDPKSPERSAVVGREASGEGVPTTLASIAANRHTEPTRLSKDVRGELDWIVMKALEKDRNRRYETASGFAADIERHLHDEPVEAGPPSTVYRFRKFAKRNKAALTTAALVCVVLVLGTVVSTWQAVRATRAERTAAVEAKKAKNEAAIVKAVNDFLNQDVLAQANKNIPIDRFNHSSADLKLVSVLDRVAGKLDGRFTDQPLVEAALRQTIGNSYQNLDRYSDAQLQLQRAVDLRRAHLGAEHPDTLTSMQSLARAKLDPDLVTRVLAVRRRVLGNGHPDTLMSMWDVAMMTHDRPQAISLFRETLEAQRRALGEDHPDTALTMYCLAHRLVTSAGAAGVPEPDDREIELMFRRALAVYRKSYGVSWHTQDITWRLGQFLHSRQRYEQAESVFQDEIMRLQALPGAFPDWAAKLNAELRGVYRSWGKPERAAEWERQREAAEHKQTVEIALRAIELAPNRRSHWQTLAWAQYRAGDWKAALASLAKVKEMGSAGDSWEWFLAAMVHWQLGDKDEARKWYDQAVAWMDMNRPANDELRRFRAEADELMKNKSEASENERKPD